MELRQLHYFVTCADNKSFSKAAAMLYTSQSNISKTIAALEAEIGQKLFERKQHGIELTERGQQVYKYAVTMLEYSNKIIDTVEADYDGELKISFQPCSWFAEAFCQYYKEADNDNIRYNIISASVEEILRRISNNLDQLGFAYIEENQLKKLSDAFAVNHIGYYTMDTTSNVLYCGRKTRDLSMSGLRLVQDCEDMYSGLSLWKNEAEDAGQSPRVYVTTNSDYIMQELLAHTELCNMGPMYNHGQNAESRGEAIELAEKSQLIHFVCIFKNDKTMEEEPKKFLSFIRKYIKAD